MRLLAIVLLITACAGCGSTAGTDVRAGADPARVIELARDRYRAGEPATLRLHNRLGEPAGYNACTWTLQLRREAGWQAAPHEGERVCTMELRTLAPGETARPDFRLDARLPAGEYRLRAVLHRLDAGSRAVRYSGTFRVDR